MLIPSKKATNMATFTFSRGRTLHVSLRSPVHYICLPVSSSSQCTHCRPPHPHLSCSALLYLPRTDGHKGLCSLLLTSRGPCRRASQSPGISCSCTLKVIPTLNMLPFFFVVVAGKSILLAWQSSRPAGQFVVLPDWHWHISLITKSCCFTDVSLCKNLFFCQVPALSLFPAS